MGCSNFSMYGAIDVGSLHVHLGSMLHIFFSSTVVHFCDAVNVDGVCTFVFPRPLVLYSSQENIRALTVSPQLATQWLVNDGECWDVTL